MKNKKSQNPAPASGAAPSAPAASSPTPAASPEDIALRAYYIYLSSGAQDGHDQENWFAAESALKQGSRSA